MKVVKKGKGKRSSQNGRCDGRVIREERWVGFFLAKKKLAGGPRA